MYEEGREKRNVSDNAIYFATNMHKHAYVFVKVFESVSLEENVYINFFQHKHFW